MNETLKQNIDTVKKLLTEITTHYQPAVLASSFSAEDMVLMDLIVRFSPEIGIFTLDTGRLPKETYELMQHVRKKYHNDITIYVPNSHELESFVTQYGPNAFYDSVTLRKQCCAIRKVHPLQRALQGKKAWLTGMRRSQSVTREDLPVKAYDETHGLQKYNPLSDWSDKDVWAYIKAFDVPYNTLHDQGYASIGCAPCTRAITPGEDIRAGRWWWENPETKECGLHVKGENK